MPKRYYINIALLKFFLKILYFFRSDYFSSFDCFFFLYENTICDQNHATFVIRRNRLLTKTRNKCDFLLNGSLTDFFLNCNVIIQYLIYQKSIMILSDLYKSNRAISLRPNGPRQMVYQYSGPILHPSQAKSYT